MFRMTSLRLLSGHFTTLTLNHSVHDPFPQEEPESTFHSFTFEWPAFNSCDVHQIHGLCYFDINCVFTPSTYHSSHHLTLVHPFSHTNAYMHSFVLATISLWNRLNEDTVLSPSLASFKYKFNIFVFINLSTLFGDHDHILAFCYIHVSLAVCFQQNSYQRVGRLSM